MLCCRLHKTANALDAMPKRIQPKAKEMLHEIGMAPARAEGHRALDAGVEMFEARYLHAVTCPKKDQDVLSTFCDLPAEHRVHVRTNKPIESASATVCLRHRKTKGSIPRRACLATMFKLLESASTKRRVLNGSGASPEAIAGIQSENGVRQNVAEESVIHKIWRYLPQPPGLAVLRWIGADDSRGSSGDSRFRQRKATWMARRLLGDQPDSLTGDRLGSGGRSHACRLPGWRARRLFLCAEERRFVAWRSGAFRFAKRFSGPSASERSVRIRG
jgi:hypothetical protein